MYCPSCEKEIPDVSIFCLYCGKPTSSTSGKIEYEYHDFRIDFSSKYKDETWVPSETYTTVAARLHFWQLMQSELTAGIQTKFLDEGWEAMSEIGPGGIQIEHRSGTIGLNWRPDRYVLTGFLLKLRRPKRQREDTHGNIHRNIHR